MTNAARIALYVSKEFGKPDVCCAGRWGAVSEAELWAREKVGREKLEARHEAGFKQTTRKKTQPICAGAPLDEDQVDQYEAHEVKVGKWEAESKVAIHNDIFWDVMDISRAAKAPWDHLLNHLQKPKDKLPTGSTHLSSLVAGKHKEIL